MRGDDNAVGSILMFLAGADEHQANMEAAKAMCGWVLTAIESIELTVQSYRCIFAGAASSVPVRSSVQVIGIVDIPFLARYAILSIKAA